MPANFTVWYGEHFDFCVVIIHFFHHNIEFLLYVLYGVLLIYAAIVSVFEKKESDEYPFPISWTIGLLIATLAILYFFNN